MKGSGAKLLLQVWLAVLFLNAAIPALCAAQGVVAKCGTAVANHRSPCCCCPIAARKKKSSAQSCCEIRIQDLGQNWQQKTPARVVTSFVPAIISEQRVTVTLPQQRAKVAFALQVLALQERDVGVHQPRAPPIAC
jgi:hypothetical protein